MMVANNIQWRNARVLSFHSTGCCSDIMGIRVFYMLFKISCLVFPLVNCSRIVLGGLFDEAPNDFNIQRVAFEHAVEMLKMGELSTENYITNEQEQDNQLHFADIQFDSIVKTCSPDNFFVVQKKVCKMFSDGVTIIFGPQHGDPSSIVQALCDAKEIPHIQMKWDVERARPFSLVNLYPFPTTLAKAFTDMIKSCKWEKFTLIYENSKSFTRIAPFLNSRKVGKVAVKLRQLDKNGDFRSMLHALKVEQEMNILIDCSTSKLREVLKQAQQVGLMTSEQTFIITNLDLHMIDLEWYQYSGVKIIGMSLFDPQSYQLQKIAKKLTDFTSTAINTRNITVDEITTEAVLIYDAVKLFSVAVRSILPDYTTTLDAVATPCHSSYYSRFGSTLTNYMKSSRVHGLTGLVKFGTEGFRNEVELYINKLTTKGLIITGIWNTTTGIHFFQKTDIHTPSTPIRDLRNMTFTVITSLTEPFAMRKQSTHVLTGNDQYEGYCIDLIHALSEISGFKYNFIIQKDKQSGNPVGKLVNNTVLWDGMIGAILEYKADLALADLTITRERERTIDFATPYMDMGIAILFRKPKKSTEGIFKFLSPFTAEVWIYVMTACSCVSIMLFIMARISPYEWRNPYPCIEKPEELENQFTLSNSFWFIFGSLMQQGFDTVPMAVSTRLAAVVWWFFTLIMVSCYTANLAAFLCAEKPRTIISTVEDLAHQNKIKYGARINGSTFNFFKDSNKPLYRLMYNYMVNNPDVMTHSSEAGVYRAEHQNYAFLMESSFIEYFTERRCSLSQVGKPLDAKGYGIAMRKGSWYYDSLSQHILKLQENGKLAELKRKWWEEKYSGSCEKVEVGGDVEVLGMPNVGGVFVVLTVGIVVAILVALAELFFYVWNASRKQKVPFKKRLIWELNFFLRFHGTIKPAFTNENEPLSELHYIRECSILEQRIAMTNFSASS